MRGLQDLLDNLTALGVSERSARRGAVNAAAQVVKREAVKNARAQGLVSTGALVNNIAVKRERGTSDNWTEYHVGVRSGREAKGADKIAVRGSDGRIRFEYTDNPFYWHMWEFGHFNVFLRRYVPAKPFMRPAMQTKQEELIEVMRTNMADRLDRTVMKAIS